MKGKILIGILLATVLFAGCIEQPKDEKIMLGAILPLSGPVAIFGQWARQGMELALEDIGDDRLEIAFEDSKMDAKEGLSAFQKLVDVEEADIVVSAMSSVSVPLIPVSEERKIPLFLQDVTYPEITKNRPLVVRHFIQSDREATVLADYATNELGIKKAGVLYVNDEAGVGAKEAFKSVFEERDGQLLAMEAYSARDVDFKTQILKIKEKEVEAIYLFGNGPSWATALKQIRELGFEGKVLTNAAMFIPNFREAAGEAAEGVYFTYPYTDLSSEEALKFKERYVAKFGEEPAMEAYYGWDLIHVIVEALEANDWKTENLKQAVVEMKEFEGAFGKTRITEEGDFLTSVGIGIVENSAMKEAGVYD